MFHRYIPAFSAKILGVYIYSWFASRAVEYGTNEFWIHIYKYARERIIGNNVIKNQIFFQFQKSLEFRFHPHDVSHIL